MATVNRVGLAGAAAALVLLAACTTTPSPGVSTDDPSGSTEAESTTAATDATGDVAVDENGVVTESAVAGVAPRWESLGWASTFRPLEGYHYGGECEDSAWDVLYLLEAMTANVRTFGPVAQNGRSPALIMLSSRELGAADRERDLAALTHQASECVGEAPEGDVLQEAAPSVEGWEGIHTVGEDSDLYWLGTDTGIITVQLAPGLAAIEGMGLADDVRAIMELQLELAG